MTNYEARIKFAAAKWAAAAVRTAWSTGPRQAEGTEFSRTRGSETTREA
jgi:hypothetical protein